MPFAKRFRRLTLLVLVAYLAAGTLGMLLHEHVHAHSATETCCHDHACHSQSAAETESPALASTTTHDHDCAVCRVTGQPVVAAIAVTVELSARVAPDALPCPAAAPRSLAARLAQSRAPPAATV